MSLFANDLIEKKEPLSALIHLEFREVVQATVNKFKKDAYLYDGMHRSTYVYVFRQKLRAQVESALRYGSWMGNDYGCIYMIHHITFDENTSHVVLNVTCGFGDSESKDVSRDEKWVFVEEIENF